MGSKIEWTDKTWNPVTGCTKVSAGCRHCYAKTLHDMRHAARLDGKKMAPQYQEPFEVVQCHPARLLMPLKWRKPCTVFVNSMSDLFHDDVPDEFIAKVWATMALCPEHWFVVLSKRAGRMARLIGSCQWKRTVTQAALSLGELLPDPDAIEGLMEDRAFPLPNVILGVSAEDQPTFDERARWLLETPAACRVISMEPMLGPIVCGDNLNGIGWVILGGESGPGARPMEVQWAVDVHHECKAAGVPFFMKQYGAVLAKTFGAKGKAGDPDKLGLPFPRDFPALLKGMA